VSRIANLESISLDPPGIAMGLAVIYAGLDSAKPTREVSEVPTGFYHRSVGVSAKQNLANIARENLPAPAAGRFRAHE